MAFSLKSPDPAHYQAGSYPHVTVSNPCRWDLPREGYINAVCRKASFFIETSKKSVVRYMVEEDKAAGPAKLRRQASKLIHVT